MKKVFFLTVLYTSASLYCFAQTPPDSTRTVSLKEVTIEADLQYTKPNVTVYIPDANSKRTAQNAVDLLNQMAIPQINVNPVSGSVLTSGGDEVKVYIDMELASEAEKNALRAEDVRKVEYFVYPSDPRFNNEKYVINITLKHINYGGYAKLSATDNIMGGRYSGLAYAKMKYDNMTYDISLSDRYTDRQHNGSEQSQTFRFPLDNGMVENFTRDNLLDNSRYQENHFGVSFRARYSIDNMSLSNTLCLTALNTPNNDYQGQLIFNPDVLYGDHYSNTLNTKNIYPRWSGSYYFKLPNGFSLNTMPSLFYSHTESDRFYKSGQTSIKTKADEKAVTGQLNFQINKTFKNSHTVILNVLGVYYHDKIKYTGNTVASPEFNQFAYGGILGYSFSFQKLYTKINGGFAGESNKISGIRNNCFIPLMYLSTQYSFSNKNSLGFNIQYNINPVEASDKTPDIIQDNELLYITGNPNLKNTHWSKANIDYTWLPDNKFSLNISSGWRRYFNRPIPYFTPDGPDGSMLRTIINDGDYQDIFVTTSFSAKLLERKLVMRIAPIIWFEKTTGIYAENNNYFNVNLSGSYYFRDFYVSAYYSSTSRLLLQYNLSATSSKSKSSYQIKFGWRKGNWNLSASAINIFRRSWVSDVYYLNSKWFDQTKTIYGNSSHQQISVAATYTFGFGKKVKRGDEIEIMENGNSAILK